VAQCDQTTGTNERIITHAKEYLYGYAAVNRVDGDIVLCVDIRDPKFILGKMRTMLRKAKESKRFIVLVYDESKLKDWLTISMFADVEQLKRRLIEEALRNFGVNKQKAARC
jgi:hypothetical protein